MIIPYILLIIGVLVGFYFLFRKIKSVGSSLTSLLFKIAQNVSESFDLIHALIDNLNIQEAERTQAILERLNEVSESILEKLSEILRKLERDPCR